MTEIKLRCEHCRVLYTPYRIWQKYCSRECSNSYRVKIDPNYFRKGQRKQKPAPKPKCLVDISWQPGTRIAKETLREIRSMIGPLILTIAPRGKPGIFIGKLEGTGLTIRATRHPLVDAARALLLVGADPQTVLIMRNHGSEVDRVRGQIGNIVKNISRKGSAGIRPFPADKSAIGAPREAS